MTRIGLISSAVPFVNGGGRLIVESLAAELEKRGHAVVNIFIPTSDEPETILQQMAALRMISLQGQFDAVITGRPPAHLVAHPNKIVWFIHHVRIFYDLWNTPYCPVPDNPYGRAIRAAVMDADSVALKEAKRVFTNSRVVGERLRHFNQIDSVVLYPPVRAPERFQCGPYGDEILCISRIEHHKRQHLLVEAMRFVKSKVRLRLCGTSTDNEYLHTLKEAVIRHRLEQSITIEDRWVSEEEKAAHMATALAVAYVPFDEDSYGYLTIEAAHACRCTVTTTDSGGVGEFVSHGENGLVVDPEPELIGAAFDRLYLERDLARRLGEAGTERIRALGIDWDTVITSLLA